MIKKIADYFGVSVEFLLEQKEKPFADGEEPIGPKKQALIDKIKNMSDDEVNAFLTLLNR